MPLFMLLKLPITSVLSSWNFVSPSLIPTHMNSQAAIHEPPYHVAIPPH
jgi:hypothetical protein